jgi:adenine-specific DNA-methyltransferase
MTEHLETERLDLASLDIAAEKQDELLRLFPEVRTEGGKVDFERLRLALGESVDVGKERYGMNWPGKADCFKAIQRPSLGTLLPVRDESVNFDETENLIIEGDNLEVLKLLQKSYQGKVKMIYIDPPYNTGNDFIYPDNYSESLETYLEYTGQVDNEGRKFSNNVETDGRFHSKWLNMMYPRLYVARNLMREDGVIFISIGQGEIANLINLCSDIFGEENRVGIISRQMKTGGNSGKFFSPNIEYIVVIAKNQEAANPFRDEMPEELKDEVYTQVCKIGPRKGERYRLMGLYQSSLTLERSRNARYFITCPDGSKAVPPEGKRWRVIEPSYFEMLQRDDIEFLETPTSPLIDEQGRRSKWNVYSRIWLTNREEEGRIPVDLITKFENRISSKQLQELGIPYDFAKPFELIEFLGQIMQTSDDDIVLDFFAGSGTTAHSVLELNRSDGKNRKFILAQLPEPTGRDDFKTIAEITKERVRRVIERYEKEAGAKLGLGNRPKEGFRVLRLATSNFSVWDATTESTTLDALAEQLDLHIDHIQKDRDSEGLLYEILLKSGFPLTIPVETLTIEGKTVYSVSNGAMLICLDRQLTHEAIKAIAERKPERVVCLDEGFAGNDQLKTNAVLIMKAKGVTKFQTI